ncbi:MAG: hypothetical protein KDL87_08005, partial [Verrucomicrobiae bacterium]|nr:hypothetical protein [Verrucomicrobiae bacterium]
EVGESILAGNDRPSVARVWQGLIDSGAAAPAYCLPVRDHASGNTLFTLMSESSVVALQQADSAPKLQP